ncbi:ferric-dicitrate binding protein FerR (iron transport regulator) [Pedobacter sp. AK017]|uniref:FecR family protein n=1 Tax=Pedobacter sp. AK017 TaxID=2723073 RepID=UPI00160FDCF5|nr:FecR family protein [Pedobacter sp. AK017]MBB5439514.1 ferric-dicitrate binding protein FerR (iron transport regulator) [Pedobacter sp. AK017]
MDNKEVNELLDRYFSGNCTPEEKSLVERAYSHLNKPYNKDITEEQFQKMKDEVWNNLNLNAEPARKTLWPGIAIAAAAVAAIVFGLFFFKAPRHSEPGSGSASYTNDIAPGKNTATLTLANGKTIILSDVKTGVIVNADKLSYNDGTAVEHGYPGEGRDEVVMSTPRGGMYQLTLPDGSHVWLNADTKISFPSQFIGKERKILLLYGEAYFEAAKNKQKPFVVESDGQLVTVLGTHFNISAYKDEGAIKTTLLEGSVRVSLSRGKRSEKNGPLSYRRQDGQEGEAVVLKPNQQSLVTENRSISIKPVDIEQVVAWKNSQFMFESENIQTIMKMVERWYNVDVVYTGEITDEKFGGGVSRFDNVSKVLKSLESTGKVHFKIEGRKIYVSK